MSATPATMSPKLVCRQLWKIFGPQPEQFLATELAEQTSAEQPAPAAHVVAVRNVSFEVHSGETFIIMGLSGSGKSTLLRCLPRLIQPTHGTVHLDGAEITAMPAKELRAVRRHQLSMVFQHFGLFPHRTILDNVAFGLEVQGVRRAERYARARAMLAQVNLQAWESHYPDELSGGMQQRVGLARALAVDPDILLFDEPFSALDPLIRREMQDELLALQAHMRKTIIFITHDFAEAIKLATAIAPETNGQQQSGRIAIMKDGRFVQVGSAEEIILHPVDQYVADFTQDVPRTSVLTARSIMSAPTSAADQRHPIAASLTLDALVALFADTDATLPVVDDSGTIIGTLNRRTVLLAVSQNGAAL